MRSIIVATLIVLASPACLSGFGFTRAGGETQICVDLAEDAGHD